MRPLLCLFLALAVGCASTPPPIDTTPLHITVHTSTAGIGDPPCPPPFDTWPECVEMSFDRSLYYEELFHQSEVEVWRLEHQLARTASIAPESPEEPTATSSPLTLGLALVIGVLAFAAGFVVRGSGD